MAALADKIRVETDNLERVLEELQKISVQPEKNLAEVAGMAAFIHNFYSGIENIHKQVFAEKGLKLPSSASWHKELLENAFSEGVLTESTKTLLGKFLVFRHFFMHSYGFMLDEDEIAPLVSLAPQVFEAFQREIQVYLQQ